MEKEIRNLSSSIRSEEGRHISGYALRFNSQSEDLGFYETILPEAVTEETIKRSDVLALFNHDESRGILARSKYGVGNLTLTVDSEGLRYDFDALETQLGDEVLAYIRSGIVGGSSFAFTVSQDEGAQEWRRDSNGTVFRTIRKIDRLFDISPVINPAYAATTCSCRSYDKFIEDEEKAKALEAKYDELLQKLQ